MNTSGENRFNTAHAFLMFVAALTFSGCGPVSIGSDKCDLSSCSALAKPAGTQCADGSVTAPTGACVKAADGVCAWEMTTCASACTPGTSKPAGDGCNECTCTAGGTWACTLMGCDTTCSYKGVRYADGVQFTSSEGCCQCTAGTVRCSIDAAGCDGSCVYGGKTYPNGASVPSGDTCNTCTCYQGQVACTTMGCVDPTICSESDCGAKPHSVPYVCSDGSTGGFTGQCVRDASGACSWEVRTCPAACKEGDQSQSSDGCQKCVCLADGNWSCMELASMTCASGCNFDGIAYPDGAIFSSPSGCCACVGGQVTCDTVAGQCANACIYAGKTYSEGQTYPASDVCNTCVCKNGLSVCSTSTCTDPSTCTPEECGPQPKCATYSCEDGSIAGCTDNCYRDSSGKCSWEIRSCPGACKLGEQKVAADGCNTCTCTNTGDWACTDMSCGNSCVYNGTTYPAGKTFPSIDGCNNCSCTTEGKVACTELSCSATCADGDPGFITGACPACTVGADQTCNDDLLMSSLAGKCVSNHCSCNDGFALNPRNGKCTKIAPVSGSVCTPNVDETCNGNPPVVVNQGRCLFDGTCLCIDGNVLEPMTGMCVRQTR